MLIYLIEYDCEEDGRWIADIPALPGCMSYGDTRREAKRATTALACRTVAHRIECGDETRTAGVLITDAAE